MITLLELKELLPTWYTGLLEFETLMQIEQHLLEDLVASIERAQGNLYVSTADSETIAIYERMLRITRQADDTLDMRRFRVLTRLSSQKPYTLRYLSEMLGSIGDNISVNCVYDEYTLLVYSVLEKRGQMDDIDYILRTVVPANLRVSFINQLVANKAAARIALAAVMTVDEFVLAVHDISTQPRTRLPLSVGTVATSSGAQVITHDFKDNQRVSVQAALGAVATTDVEVLATHDVNSHEVAKVDMLQGTAMMTVETYIIE